MNSCEELGPLHSSPSLSLIPWAALFHDLCPSRGHSWETSQGGGHYCVSELVTHLLVIGGPQLTIVYGQGGWQEWPSWGTRQALLCHKNQVTPELLLVLPSVAQCSIS